MFPRLETPSARAPRSQQPPAGARHAGTAQGTRAPGARLRRAADRFLALLSLDALGSDARRDNMPVHPHRRPAGVDLPARRAGMPPRPDQVCVTPRLQARRLRDAAPR